jgi:hypothetical protein
MSAWERKENAIWENFLLKKNTENVFKLTKTRILENFTAFLILTYFLNPHQNSKKNPQNPCALI